MGRPREGAPDIAREGRELLDREGILQAQLATVRGDGLPRINPVWVGIVDGRLYSSPLEDRPTSKIEQMIAEGRITPATRRWEDVPPPLPPLEGKPLSQILQEMRDEDPK